MNPENSLPASNDVILERLRAAGVDHTITYYHGCWGRHYELKVFVSRPDRRRYQIGGFSKDPWGVIATSVLPNDWGRIARAYFKLIRSEFDALDEDSVASRARDRLLPRVKSLSSH